MYNFIISALAVYGISWTLAYKSGPKDIVRKLNLPQCAVCLSFYVALPIALLSGLTPIDYFGLVGVTVILEQVL